MKAITWVCLGIVAALSVTAIVTSSVALSRQASSQTSVAAQQGTFSSISVGNGTFQYISSPVITALSTQVNATCAWSSRILSAGQCRLTFALDPRCGNYTNVWYGYTVTSLACDATSPTFVKLSIDVSDASKRAIYSGPGYYTQCFTPPLPCQNQTCTFAGAGFTNFSSPLPFTSVTAVNILGGTNGQLVNSNRTLDMRGTAITVQTVVVGWQYPAGLAPDPLFNGFFFGFQGVFDVILAVLP